MKRILLLLLITPVVCFAGQYFMYPAKYELDNYRNCQIDNQFVQKINAGIIVPDIYKKEVNVKHYGPYGIVDKLDLNNDGVCELFVSNPVLWGSGGSFHTIEQIVNGEIKTIGSVRRGYWLGERYNGYAQILAPGYFGHKTNASLTTNIFQYREGKYQGVKRPQISFGGYSDLGAKNYKKGELEKAEYYFLNRYRMENKPPLNIANDLAIAWLKLGKLNEAKRLLENNIQNASNKKHLSAAYYNLGLIWKKKGDSEIAEKYFSKSKNNSSSTNNSKPNSSTQSKVIEIKIETVPPSSSKD